MEDYNKIIESLGVKFHISKNVKILQSLNISNFYDVENTILILNKGELKFGEEQELVKEGELLFIPGGKSVNITFGSNPAESLTNDDFMTRKDEFIKSFHYSELEDTVSENFSYVTFEAKVFDSVNFFTSLDLPPFIIHKSDRLTNIIRTVIKENVSELAGSERVVKINTDYLVVEIVRYIIKNRLFVEQLATNSTYFKDPRLIDIFAYIKENLNGDLSNKVLANVANVSEDYVGQYFKMLTGINPQDYIEYQRMEKAVQLLRTTKKSIRDIGKEVGYKDTAYFCRRFKMMFGIPAGKMRRRESLMNI